MTQPLFASEALDKQSPVPLYFQLERLVEQEIVRGTLAAGERLPSEPEFCALLDVSRSVVRQALMRLEQQGLVRRRKGQGTYVASSQPRSWLLQSASGFFEEEVDRMGRRVTSRVLRAAVEPLPLWAATALGLPEGADGMTLERLRSIDGLVALYVVNHLPAQFARTALDEARQDESLYRRLKQDYGLDVAGGRRMLEAVPAEGRLAECLEVPQHFPLVFIESVSWDKNMRPFDCYRTWVRTDRMKIDVQVAARPVAFPATPAQATMEGVNDETLGGSDDARLRDHPDLSGPSVTSRSRRDAGRAARRNPVKTTP